MDQQGVWVLPHNSYTFHEKGSRQVDCVAKDEKRAFTTLIASTASGNFLPIQQFWGGKTKGSLPRRTAIGMEDALARSFHFTVAASETSPHSHFSTLKTMKEWVAEIMQPYVKSVIEGNPDLLMDQKSVLFIDIYPVHKSEAFTSHIYTEYLHIIIIFVPGNCTGIFQPADAGLQCIVKHCQKQCLFCWLVEEQRKQVAGGIDPNKVRITTSYPELWDASIHGLVEVYDFMNSPDGQVIVKMVRIILHTETIAHLHYRHGGNVLFLVQSTTCLLSVL